jgi:hypothetical protein
LVEWTFFLTAEGAEGAEMKEGESGRVGEWESGRGRQRHSLFVRIEEIQNFVFFLMTND